MRLLSSTLMLCWLTLLSLPTAHAQLSIFACEPEWAALAKHLGGPHVQTTAAITAFQDPHFIEARPSLIAKTRRADLIICTGSELEIGWLPLLLRKAGNRNVMPGQPGHFMAADQVTQIDIPDNLDRRQGDVHAGGNPHVHLSPHRLAKIARALTETLSTLDPANQAAYQALGAQFQQDWQAAIDRWTQQAAPLKGTQVIVYHKDWSYLLDWLGMTAVADLEPKPGIPPSSTHLASLLTVVEKHQPAFIMMAAHRAARPAQWLSERTGIPVLTLPYTVGGHESATDLFTLFDSTLTQLLKQLPANKALD